MPLALCFGKLAAPYLKGPIMPFFLSFPAEANPRNYVPNRILAPLRRALDGAGTVFTAGWNEVAPKRTFE